MKNLIASATVLLALAFSAQGADVSAQLTDVHLCCQSCVKGVAKATSNIQGLTATADSDAGTVSLTGPDTATVQKGVDALVAAGYFGKSSDPAIKVAGVTGAKDQKTQSLEIEGLHLCCDKCVKSVNRTLGGVSGVKTNTAVKNAKSFTVSGDFNDKEAFDALQKSGLTGHVAK